MDTATGDSNRFPTPLFSEISIRWKQFTMQHKPARDPLVLAAKETHLLPHGRTKESQSISARSSSSWRWNWRWRDSILCKSHWRRQILTSDSHFPQTFHWGLLSLVHSWKYECISVQAISGTSCASNSSRKYCCLFLLWPHSCWKDPHDSWLIWFGRTYTKPSSGLQRTYPTQLPAPQRVLMCLAPCECLSFQVSVCSRF